MPGEELGEYVGWLSRRFRYRDLGLPRSLYEADRGVFEGRLGGNPFHVLSYPTRRVEEAARDALEVLVGRGLPETIAEAILLAASYASPIIATPAASERLIEISIHVVKSKVMDAKEARLHLRIVDYSVLDAYVESIEEFVNIVSSGGSPGELREARRRRAERDAKRYWRIAGKGDTPAIIYPEHTVLLLEAGLGERLTGPEERILAAQLVAFNLAAVEK